AARAPGGRRPASRGRDSRRASGRAPLSSALHRSAELPTRQAAEEPPARSRASRRAGRRRAPRRPRGARSGFASTESTRAGGAGGRLQESRRPSLAPHHGGSSMSAAPEIRSEVQKFVARRHQMLIDGKFVPAASGRTFPSYNPATGEVLAQV